MDITSFLIGLQKGKASAAAGTHPDVRYVTFMNGAEVLYVKPVATGDDCVDVLTKGLISTPTKASTVDTVYTYSGWALTDGGEKDANALTAVTENRTVYAAYTSAVRKYNVRFYDGNTLLKTEAVAYGGSSTYTYDKEGYVFNGWNPTPTNITKDTDCYGTWVEQLNFATSSWADISRVAENGTASSMFALGDRRTVPLALPNGSTLNIEMEIIAFGHDDLADGNGKAGLSILSVPVITYEDLKAGLDYRYGLDTRYGDDGAWLWGEGRIKHTMCNTHIYSYLPSELQTVIKSVTKLYRNTDKALATSVDKIWIPSRSEMGGGIQTTGQEEDGTKYGYFTDLFYGLERRKKKNLSGTATVYMTRTPSEYNNNFSSIVNTDGAHQNNSGASGYFAFGFCV